MELHLRLDMLPQPNWTTCGPTCLHAVYSYFRDEMPLAQIIGEVPALNGGGTLAVHLACHALRRGYAASIYTTNLNVFDPTWFAPGAPKLAEQLALQLAHKPSERLAGATRAYLDFLQLGGTLLFEDLTPSLIRRQLRSGTPILAGLSATYLYRSPRECGQHHTVFDDVRGEPSGHFVVLCGYDGAERSVLVADPLLPNPFAPTNQYVVNIDRLACAILLGCLTFDDNLLLIRPKRRLKDLHANPHRRQ